MGALFAGAFLHSPMMVFVSANGGGSLLEHAGVRETLFHLPVPPRWWTWLGMRSRLAAAQVSARDWPDISRPVQYRRFRSPHSEQPGFQRRADYPDRNREFGATGQLRIRDASHMHGLGNYPDAGCDGHMFGHGRPARQCHLRCSPFPVTQKLHGQSGHANDYVRGAWPGDAARLLRSGSVPRLGSGFTREPHVDDHFPFARSAALRQRRLRQASVRLPRARQEARTTRRQPR